MALSEDRRATLSAMAERRGQGRVVRVKGKGKVGALVNAANGAQASLTNGLGTMRGALNQVVKAARDLGKDDIVRAIQSELRDIERAEEVLRSVLGKLDTPSAVGESDEEPGVPAMDGEGPHGAGMGPRAKKRKARKGSCRGKG
jgi:hypothetical protein